MSHQEGATSGKAVAGLAVAALGVVYGDIGTSPLYALKEVFAGPHSVAMTRDNILGLEDNAPGPKLIRPHLDGPEYRVTLAADGGQALLEIGRNVPDLILLDIDLPVVDGLTLLDVLRRNEMSIPTILMTAMPGEQSEVQGLDLGAADFIRKPVQKAVLLKRIEKALRASRGGVGRAVNH